MNKTLILRNRLRNLQTFAVSWVSKTQIKLASSIIITKAKKKSYYICQYPLNWFKIPLSSQSLM
jgi:hypothetical protein